MLGSMSPLLFGNRFIPPNGREAIPPPNMTLPKSPPVHKVQQIHQLEQQLSQNFNHQQSQVATLEAK